MKVRIKQMCTRCWGSGYITAGSYPYDGILTTRKCVPCNGYGYIFVWEDVPNDVQELPAWNSLPPMDDPQ
jgi:hypothetical protein